MTPATTRFEADDVVFDLAAVFAGSEVYTRDGRPVRFVVLVPEAQVQPLVMLDLWDFVLHTYTHDGRYLANGDLSTMDLITRKTLQ